MAKKSDKDIIQDKIRKTVSEFKDGTLKRPDGGRVLNMSQAMAIGIEKGKKAVEAARKKKKK